MTDRESSLLRLLMKPVIAFHTVYVDVTGSHDAALFLSQSYYHSVKDDGPVWFTKTYKDWLRETKLKRYEVDKARKQLATLGLLEEETREVAPGVVRIFYRVNEDQLHKLVLQTVSQGGVENLHPPVSSQQGGVENSQGGVLKTDNLARVPYSDLEKNTEREYKHLAEGNEKVSVSPAPSGGGVSDTRINFKPPATAKPSRDLQAPATILQPPLPGTELPPSPKSRKKAPPFAGLMEIGNGAAPPSPVSAFSASRAVVSKRLWSKFYGGEHEGFETLFLTKIWEPIPVEARYGFEKSKKMCDNMKSEDFTALLEGIKPWHEYWQQICADGKAQYVKSLPNFLSEKLWREKPRPLAKPQTPTPTGPDKSRPYRPPVRQITPEQAQAEIEWAEEQQRLLEEELERDAEFNREMREQQAKSPKRYPNSAGLALLSQLYPPDDPEPL